MKPTPLSEVLQNAPLTEPDAAEPCEVIPLHVPSFPPGHFERIERERRAMSDSVVRQFEASAYAVVCSGLDPADSDLVRSGSYQETAAIRHVRRWFETPGDDTRRVMMLFGGVGAGKTMAGRVLMRLHVEKRLDEYRALDPDALLHCLGGRGAFGADLCLAAHLAPRTNPWKGEAERYPHASVGAPVFVLDDLGTERADDHRFHEALFELIDARTWGHLLITSNLKKSDIRARYGDRVADRLNHRGVAVEIGGKSLRRQGAGL